jgi:hypothetical protein
VERINNRISKEKSKAMMKELLEEFVPLIKDEELLDKVSKQINKY